MVIWGNMELSDKCWKFAVSDATADEMYATSINSNQSVVFSHILKALIKFLLFSELPIFNFEIHLEGSYSGGLFIMHLISDGRFNNYKCIVIF